jgi:hypothetical protein
LENEIIWIDGSNARYTRLDESYYYKAIDDALQRLQQEMELSSIYVKLRPGLKDIDNNYLVAAIKRMGWRVNVLPDDMILECLFMTSRNCIVIGNLTAALEYAHVFGHKAYSIYSLFEKQAPTFLDRMEGFWKNVKSFK